MTENQLSGKIISAAIKVHKAPGPGLLESAYRECLFYELNKQGFIIEKEKALPIYYDSVQQDVGYRIDLLIEKRIIVEIKSVESFKDIHLAQILTYLKLSDLHLGLFINFNVIFLRQGIKRVVNGYIKK